MESTTEARGEFYENDIPIYFGERHLDKLAGVTEGAKVEVHFGLKGRAYTYTDKTDGKTQRSSQHHNHNHNITTTIYHSSNDKRNKRDYRDAERGARD